MEILKVLALRGPNIWSRRTVLEAWVDLGDLRDKSSATVPGLAEKLSAWLPGLEEHRCSLGVRGGFLTRVREGTYPAHILEHVTIELQTVVGAPVGFGKARETSQPGVYRVVVRYKDETVARACLLAAKDIVVAAFRGEECNVQMIVSRLKEVADSAMLGPSTMAIVEAAEKRGIPWRRLGEHSLVVLGHGFKQRRVWTTETDRTGAIAESIARDKHLTKQLLRKMGIPVPQGEVVKSPIEAWETAQEIGLPVVVKPLDGNHGRAVFLALTTQEQVQRAYEAAACEGTGVLVEKFVEGDEHRLLVVDGRVVAACRGRCAYVTGDGVHTVRELIDLQLNSDPRRGRFDDTPLNPVEIDETVLMELTIQGFGPDSIPAEGQQVLVQRNGNLFEETDAVHESVRDMAVLAARAVGLDVAGVDIVTRDISQPLTTTGGAVVEVNAGPALHVHLKPEKGQPRPVGEAIVDSLFGPGEDGRIPIICVTGILLRNVISRKIFSFLRALGKTGLGFASSEGLFLDEKRLASGDFATAEGARRLLINPKVRLALVEAHPDGILQEGLGFDKCDVAVVTDISEPKGLSYPFVSDVRDMFDVLRCPVDVVRATGAAVIGASHPLLLEMVPLSAGKAILVGDTPEFEREAKVVRVSSCEGRTRVTSTFETLEFPFASDVAALFTLAVAWVLGFSSEEIARGLASSREKAEL